MLYYAFSAMLVPMREELGWSLTVLSGGFSFALLLSGLVAPWAGRWLDRHGGRALMTAGSALATLAVVAWSRVETVPGYFAAWALIGLAMAATLYEPAFVVLTAWFNRHRARAMLILTVAGGFASTIFLPVTNGLIGALGWRDALLVLAAVVGVGTVLPHALLLRRRPEDLGLVRDGDRPPPPLPDDADGDAPVEGIVPVVESDVLTARTAMRLPTWWWLVAAFVLGALATNSVVIFLLAYLLELGYDPDLAALIAGAFGLFAVAGRILTSSAGRFASRGQMTLGLFTAQAVAIAVLLAFGGFTAGLLVFIVLFGASAGGLTLARAMVVADFFGRRAFGEISGTMALFMSVARAASPVGIGLAYGLAGGYRPVFLGLALLAVCSAAAMAVAERRRPALTV